MTSPKDLEIISPAFKAAQPETQFSPKFRQDLDWARNEGWVKLEIDIAADGTVSNASVLERLGPAAHADAAVEAARAWRFKPATLNGQAIAQYGLVVSHAFLVNRRVMTSSTEFPHVAEIKANSKRALREGDQKKQIQILEDGIARNLAGLPMFYDDQADIALMLSTAYWETKDFGRARRYARMSAMNEQVKLVRDHLARAWRLERASAALSGDYKDILCRDMPVEYESAGDKTISNDLLAKIESAVRTAASVSGPLTTSVTLPAADGDWNWERALVRRAFRFANLEGELKEFELKCTTDLIRGPVAAQSILSVPDDAGPCTVRVKGSPGAKFAFIETWE
jgi:TonB family protein